MWIFGDPFRFYPGTSPTAQLLTGKWLTALPASADWWPRVMPEAGFLRIYALASLFSVLKPGGRLLVLEFSHAHLGPLAPLYELYSFQVLPRLGRWLAGDAASYRYLAESIRRHPDQETLKGMMERVGFERCEYFNLTAGVVALHLGFRL